MINLRNRRRPALSIGVVAALSVAANGCGSDAKTAATTAATASPNTAALTTARSAAAVATTEAVATTDAPDATDETATPAAFDGTAYCRAEVALESASSAAGDPSEDPVGFATALLPLAQASQAAAPAELAATFATETALLQQVIDIKDADVLNSLDVLTVHAFDAANCAWTGEEVTLESYMFDNLPSTLGAGDYDFEVNNTSTEAHLLLIVKRKAGVTDSWDELLASADGQDKVDTVAAAFTAPGGSAYAVTHLDAGEYLALCPISKGSTADTEGTGPPHFTLGMQQVITVK
ncbi:MAG: exported protein of unknown function [Ilumatobacteraceae bacterium]|nr:exported protein of unknown function [Ilumatobacteraceae bacterium]